VLSAAFDIDGTLARSPFNPANIAGMPPNPVTIRTLRMLRRAGMKIIIVTARPERFRADTVAWLRSQAIVYDDLRMRPRGDNRPDELLRAEQVKGAAILFDDKPTNCARVNVPCVLV
jgi:hypothetical protein